MRPPVSTKEDVVPAEWEVGGEAALEEAVLALPPARPVAPDRARPLVLARPRRQVGRQHGRALLGGAHVALGRRELADDAEADLTNQVKYL